MNSIKRSVLVLLGVLALGGVPAGAQEATMDEYTLRLSPGLMELLRAEMRALLTGIQYLPVGIATAEWKKVAQTSAQINASYILEQKLTPAMRAELTNAVPGHFKRLDLDFHREAKKLETAARNHNAQLAAFHYYRLIETCTVCHSAFAVSKFPGFEPATMGAHDR